MIYVHFCRSKTCIVAPWVSRERPISADIACSNEDAEDYAEGVRRGGTLVSAKVADADRARLDAILNRSAVNLQTRRVAWQNSGWKAYDPAAKPYSAEEVRKERSLYGS